MKITVKNFGPIREAKDIEISPMTLFVGPSNTGKSYLAILMYSIFKVLKTPIPINRFPRNKINQQRIKNYNDNIEKFLDTSLDSPEMQKITEDLTELIIRTWTSYAKKRMENQILYCFGEAGKKLLQNEEMSIVLSSNNKKIVVNIGLSSENKIPNKVKRMIFSKILLPIREAKVTNETEFDRDLDLYRALLNNMFATEFTFLLLGKNHSVYNRYYLPAIRGGIMQSHLALIDGLIEQAPTTGLTKTKSTPMFNGVLADFMRNLIRMRENERFSNAFPPTNVEEKIISIGRDMETNIMQGKIEIQMTEMDHPEFHYKFNHNNNPHDLSLINASSMVSELAPVSLFIRHYLKRKDFFIVEEPEGNLHPEGQRDIANVLVQLANAKVFVLVTTHSDNILEQVNNCVHASKLNPDKLKALGEPLVPLEKDPAAYSFVKDIKHGTKVEKIPFSPTTGLITKDHLRVSSDLYNQTVRLLDAQNDEE